MSIPATITPEQIEGFADTLGTVFRGLVALGKITVIVFKIVTPILNAMINTVELLVTVLESLMNIPNLPKQLGQLDFKLGGDTGFGAFVKQGLGFGGDVNTEQRAKIDINQTITTPRGVIAATKTKTSGNVSGLNFGLNMEEAS